MPVITLFEHQSITYGELGLAAGDPFCAAVDRLNAAAGCAPGGEILHAGRTTLRAGSWVGVVRVGQWLVEILPRLDYEGPAAPVSPAPGSRQAQPRPAQTKQRPAAQAAASAAHNLLALLAYAWDLPLRAVAPAGLRDRPGGWTGLLTALFAAGLRQALAGGPLQAYVPREEVLSVLRGRWDVARQAAQPLPAAHHLAVSYADYSADTPLNQVLRLALEDLLPVTTGAYLTGLLSDLRARLGTVSLLPGLRDPAALARLPAPVFDRQSEPLRLPYQLARLFLAGQSVALRAGPLPAYAFVFDMNRLFERFTAAFLARRRAETWPAAWRGALLIAQSAPGGAHLARRQGRPVLRLRPDLVFLRSGTGEPPTAGSTQVLLVGDTKYKDIGADTHGAGAPADDVYQMLAYLLRLDCPRGLLLYPQLPGRDPARRVLEITPPGVRPVQILAATINLRVPLERGEGLVGELREILELV